VGGGRRFWCRGSQGGDRLGCRRAVPLGRGGTHCGVNWEWNCGIDWRDENEVGVGKPGGW
jgi:hypothetical protein